MLSRSTLELFDLLLPHATVTGIPGTPEFDGAIKQIERAKRELAEALRSGPIKRLPGTRKSVNNESES